MRLLSIVFLSSNNKNYVSNVAECFVKNFRFCVFNFFIVKSTLNITKGGQ